MVYLVNGFASPELIQLLQDLGLRICTQDSVLVDYPLFQQGVVQFDVVFSGQHFPLLNRTLQTVEGLKVVDVDGLIAAVVPEVQQSKRVIGNMESARPISETHNRPLRPAVNMDDQNRPSAHDRL
jgi:hypothetical protein